MRSESDAVHLLLAIYGDKQDIIGWVRKEDMRGGRRRGLRFDGRHFVGDSDMH